MVNYLCKNSKKEEVRLLKNKNRLKYLLIFIILTIVEILISLFVHDKIVRPYIVDFIVVFVIYYFVRIFVIDKVKLLPLYIFLFAASVEILQYIDFISIIGLENNKFFRILMGTSFSFIDIFFYLAGCLILGVYEYIRFIGNKNQ